MFQHSRNSIVSSLIVFLITPVCLSNEMSFYCDGELLRSADYKWHQKRFLREFVLPVGGLYERYFRSDQARCLPLSELSALRSIEKELSLSPIYTSPIIVQISKHTGQGGMRHIEAICIVLQETINPPFIDPVFADIENKCISFETLAKLSQLRHIDLYGFSIEKLKFSQVSKLAGLEYLGLPYNTSDDHLNYIVPLTKLEFVNASGTQIEGKGLSVFSELPQLRILDLRNTNLIPGTLYSLRSCRSLQTLLMSDTNVTDDDLKSLVDLEGLRYLTLHGTNITDRGLKILSAVRNLKYVSLYDTQTTRKGLNVIRKNCPDLKLRLEAPPTLREFLAERQIIAACAGSKEDQISLARSYTDDVGTRPTDLIEALKWHLVLQERQRRDEKVWIYLSEEYLNQHIENCIRELDEKQVEEAHIRARAYLYLHKQSTFRFTIEREEGLPLYQYGFGVIN